jgi:hypothetical protein
MSKVAIRTALFFGVAFAVVNLLAVRPAHAADKPEVQYRLTSQRTLHLDDQATAKKYESSLQNLGCEARVGGHAGHFDLTYRCPKWRTAQFDNEDAAHQWQNWLKSLGFETAHQH